MTRKILVGIDGSENSLRALQEAIHMARAYESKLFVVNVQPTFNAIHTRVFINDELIKEYQKELYENATNEALAILEKENLDYELMMRTGDPVQQICRLAAELAVSYIVIGSRGMGLVKGTVLGSVSNGILHDSHVPVLVIPQKK
ncbi:universal stress protein [Bacillus rubiinfantis]|uniref:universal stress protein n=1 Tax=Bacillus rubiinfantis TaxID=1499680 RepID=UPI0005A92B86|nr:universal stress protein [Bacillus rubiinfantis]